MKLRAIVFTAIAVAGQSYQSTPLTVKYKNLTLKTDGEVARTESMFAVRAVDHTSSLALPWVRTAMLMSRRSSSISQPANESWWKGLQNRLPPTPLVTVS
jgi:hypothetical protein